MVQPELHPEDEGRAVDGDPRQPYANQAPAGVPEAVASEPGQLAGQQQAVAELSQSPGPFDTGAEFTLAPEGLESATDPLHAAARLDAPADQPLFADGDEALAGFSSRPLGPEATPAPLSDEARMARACARLAQIQEELVAWVKTLISAAVYAILIVTFGFQVARVEGLSMAPTLEDQDRLIVNKLAYRIGEPRRGDIVMLYYPLDPDKSFVKRVIAEEGDSVRIVDGRVYVNDVPLHDDYVPAEYRSHDDWGPQVIPEGYYFVMGDHRNNSSDSRHWGMVPKRYIIGKVQIRWWPVPTARVF